MLTEADLVSIVAQLEAIEAQLRTSNQATLSDLEFTRQQSDTFQQRLLSATTTLDDQIRTHRLEIDDARREHRNEIDQLRRDNANETDRLIRDHRDEVRELERRTTGALEDRIREIERSGEAKLEEERSRRVREVQELETRIASENQFLSIAIQKKDIELDDFRKELEEAKNAQKSLNEAKEMLQKAGLENSSTIQLLESELNSLRAKIHFLESGSKAQSDSFAEMESRLQEALRSAESSKQKLIKEETLRRILFNQVQELKGNIRVMCRVRPVFNTSVSPTLQDKSK